jgi:hypothetical protein
MLEASTWGVVEMYGLLLLLALVVVVVGLGLLGSAPGWRERIDSTARWATIAAFGLTTATALAMLPIAFGEQGGPQLIAWLAVPVLATGVALFAPFPERAKVIALWVSAFVVCAFVVLTGLSIGLFFGPAALLAVAAAVTTNQARSRPRLG